MAEALRKGRTDSEGWRVRKDGRRFWAVATLQALRDEAGQPIGFAKITRDMTSEREAALSRPCSKASVAFPPAGRGRSIDYAASAIYMLDPNGIVTNWNAQRRADQGI